MKIQDTEELSPEITVLSSREDVLNKMKDQGFCTAFYCKIKNQQDMEEAWKIGSRMNYLLIELSD